jgi:acyl carrier protein
MASGALSNYDDTLNRIRQLLAKRFRLNMKPEELTPETPLFSVGVGLTSLEGMDLLLELEKQFKVKISDPDWWIEESPTLDTATRHIMKLQNKPS